MKPPNTPGFQQKPCCFSPRPSFTTWAAHLSRYRCGMTLPSGLKKCCHYGSIAVTDSPVMASIPDGPVDMPGTFIDLRLD